MHPSPSLLILAVSCLLIACADERALQPAQSDGSSAWGVVDPEFPRPGDDGVGESTNPTDPGGQGDEGRLNPEEPGELTEDLLCLDVGDIEQYPSCCDEAPTRCVPADLIPEAFHEVVAPCDGGLCIPEPMFELEGVTELRPCTAIAGLEGACLSRCVPQVAENAALLTQDVCVDGDLCVPCVSPLDGTDTGVCGVFDCNHPKSAESVEPEPEPEPTPTPTCEEPPEQPLIDPTIFPSCCDGARCIPTDLVPTDLQSDLDLCDDGASLCVPEPFIAWGDFYVPNSCALGDGSPGRCMSTCLPAVAERIDQLPQAGCADNERCSPCCDFYSGEPTGSCGFGCDAWEDEGGTCDVIYEPCCEEKGGGHCIPQDNIPSDLLENVERLGCDQGNVCVPDEITDPDVWISVCTGTIPLVNEPYTGVCLSKCLKIPMDILIWSGSCPSTHDCVPCVDPLSGQPTGAPGCENL